MDSMEKVLSEATSDGIIPGAVVAATNATGSFNYSKAFGWSLASKKNPSSQRLSTDSVFMIASCTKLMTSIAVLQCVERGLFGLDDDVCNILPELAALEILVEFDANEQPVTRKRKTPITPRHLLTHTAGLGYDHMSPKLQRYRQSRNQRLGGSGGTVDGRFNCPLLYEPGTSWGYSPAIDWAGLLVERATSKTLEDYMIENLWRPLGIKDMTFWPSKHPHIAARVSSVCIRDPEGGEKAVVWNGGLMNDKNSQCFGGQGCYASMPEYLKILRSLLIDDENLLKKATARQLFSPQLSQPGRSFLNSLRDRPEVWGNFVGEFPRDVELDWGLGGILTLQPTSGWREKKTLIWSGLPNLFWFIDRGAGLCGIFATQLLPPGDDATGKLITIFEKAMYAEAKQIKTRL